MSSGDTPKLKILCIHGYRQSEKTFREKTGSLRKILKKYADLTYITAPNIVLNEDEETEQYGWWFSAKNSSYNAMDYTEYCNGFNDSIECVAQAFSDLGPFDGVLAFSQGASLLSIICGMIQAGDNRFPFKFAIFVAGFRSRQAEHKIFYEQKINIPSLHVIGDTDQVIAREMSDKLLEDFVEPVVLRHAGGHFVPTSSAQKGSYFKFLEKFMK